MGTFNNFDFNEIKSYFQDKLDRYGTSAQGADWNSVEAQETRFAQLARVINPSIAFTLLDYGCGYGGFADYLRKTGYKFSIYYGFDILESMVNKGRELHPAAKTYVFTHVINELVPVDYVIASGIFNIRLDITVNEWTKYVLQTLDHMNSLSIKGMAVNFLTGYSDPERMRPDLYYADPCFLFDYCKRKYSKNVALNHDYDLFDFTLIIRK